MYLSKVRVANYKCFSDSGELLLEPGLTVVVGTNNSGKSALLQALHGADPNDHRCIRHVAEGNSPQVDFEITASKAEVEAQLRTPTGHRFYLPESAWNEVSGPQIFRDWLATETPVVVRGQRRSRDVLATMDGFGLWKPRMGPNGPFLIGVPPEGGAEVLRNVSGSLEQPMVSSYFGRSYRFNAERPRLGSCASGTSSRLEADARNLPEVLDVLDTNPARYATLMAAVSRVVPSVKWVKPVPIDNQMVRLDVWFVGLETERKDLTIPLSDCGTGLGQVLAILYVALFSEPCLLMIDEPQAFLHPAAARELVRIVASTKHQCIVTTHSAEVIGAVESSALVRIESDERCSWVRSLDRSAHVELQRGHGKPRS